MAHVVPCPSEAGADAGSGWVSGTASYISTASLLRSLTIDSTVYSGNYVVRSNTTFANSTMYSPIATDGLKQYFLKSGAYVKISATSYRIQGLDGAGTVIFEVNLPGVGNVATLEDATGVLATTTWVPLAETWYLLEVAVIHDGTNGYMRLLIDNDEKAVYSGAVSVGDGNGVKQWQMVGNDYAYWDDFGVNSITLRYRTGTFIPTVGEVMTGAGGGVATVTTVAGTAASGVMTCHLWNDTAFIGGELITGDGTASVNCDAPNADFVNGFEPESSYLGNSIDIGFFATADGNSSQLYNSAGTHVNNYSYIDENPVNTSDFCEARVAAERDTYTFGNIAAGLPAASVSTVSSVSLHTYGRASVTGIDGLQLVTRYSGTDYDEPRQAMGTGNTKFFDILSTRPDDDVTIWTVTSVAASEFGIVFVV